MSLLVTGAGGQLGREWVRYLQEQRRDHHSCSSSELDITDPDAVLRLLDRLKPEVVVNCAAWTDVEGAEESPGEAMRVNRDGVGELASWCAQNGARMVHYSTDYVFGGRRGDELRYPDGYPEEAPLSPVNRYGESKLAGERVLTGSGTDFLLIRLSWVCGFYGGNFVKTMLRLGRKRERIEVVSDQVGSPSWARTVPPLTDRLLNRQEEGIFHLASAGKTSWYGLAREIFRLSGIDVELQPVESRDYPSKAHRPLYSKLDTSRLCSTLDVEMESWQQGLKRLIEELNEAANDLP